MDTTSLVHNIAILVERDGGVLSTAWLSRQGWKVLISDLQRLFDANGTMSIPWNMIVDTQGHIVQLHAPRPSDTEALSAALDSVK